MRTDRLTYLMDAWPKEKALEEIISLSGKAFDPSVVDAFLAVADHPLGEEEA